MTAHDINLVKKSWATIGAINMETVGVIFYTKLFEIAPGVKQMFIRSTIAEQSGKLISMLSYILDKIDKLDDILEDVSKLAMRHSKYGVLELHYRAVYVALIYTLEKALGEQWNDELKHSWFKVYTILSDAMIRVQNEILIYEQANY